MDEKITRWVYQDLTAAAKAGRLPKIFCIDDLIEQAEALIDGEPARSPVLVGQAGVGKTAVVYGLVTRAAEGRGSRVLRDRSVLEFSIRRIASAFKETHEVVQAFEDLLDALTEEDVVPYIADLHLVYNYDLESVLSGWLHRSSVPLIGEGERATIDRMLSFEQTLAQHLMTLPVDEPRGAQLNELIQQWAAHQTELTGKRFLPDAVRVAIEVTGRYYGQRRFPRKVLELLAQARDTLVVEEGMEPAIDVRTVVRRFSIASRVPPTLVDPGVPLDLVALRRFLEERLLGQSEAVDAVVRLVAMMKAGLTDPSRPFGVYMFVGPTGVGKTHTAQLLAEYLFGDRNRMVRLNLNDCTEPHHVLQLFGNPEHHNPDAKAGRIAVSLRGHPFGVLLLDEFEKAHRDVHNAFLQAFDEGTYTNGAGEIVSLRSHILIATSNAGAEVYRTQSVGFRNALDNAALDTEIDRILHRLFAFELLNRFDRVVHFHPLERAHIRAIARRELDGLVKRDELALRSVTVEVEPEVVEWLAAHGWHPQWGARFLRRTLDREVLGPLADAIVRVGAVPRVEASLSVRGNTVQVRTTVGADPTAEIKLPEASGSRVVALDETAMRAEAHAWLERWSPLRAAAEGRRKALEGVVTETQGHRFWDDSDHAAVVMRRYADLEARVQSDDRLVEPIVRLEKAAVEDRWPTMETLARLVEKAAWNWQRSVELGDAETLPSGWLLIDGVDTLTSFPEIVAQLVAMYQAWLPRRGLDVRVVAEQEDAGDVVAAVLEVSGPGWERVVAMEEGGHRWRTPDGQTARARVVRVTRLGGAVAVESARDRKGVLVDRRRFRARVDLPLRGLTMTWLGPDQESLGAMGADLEAALAAPRDLEPARTYAITGGTVRDPRTGASLASVKEAWRGGLDTLWEAWVAAGR